MSYNCRQLLVFDGITFPIHIVNQLFVLAKANFGDIQYKKPNMAYDADFKPYIHADITVQAKTKLILSEIKIGALALIKAHGGELIRVHGIEIPHGK